MLLEGFLNRLITQGTLEVVYPDGRQRRFGSGAMPRVKIRLHTPGVARRLFFQPTMEVGEAFMNGELTIEEGSLYEFLDLAGRNLGTQARLPFEALRRRLKLLMRTWHAHNPIGRAQQNVAHHYDLSDTLYDLFLDGDRQYSCAYFSGGNDSLEVAQDNKKRHIAAKLLLEPGQKVLDIGSGWGGMAVYLAKIGRVDVTGVTLSREQHAYSNRRAQELGLADRVRFHLRDYREEKGRYDRIVSVGMFEHVGQRHYPEFFAKVAELLNEDGVMLLHTIGRMDPPGGINPWIAKYIFPGAYTPALSETMEAIEGAGLWATDVEVLRLHYAKTLREWRRRFMDNRDRVKAIYDERFCRMWEFYLAACEVGFRHMGQLNFQIQIAHKQDAVPLTRDYITDWERAHMGEEALAQ